MYFNTQTRDCISRRESKVTLFCILHHASRIQTTMKKHIFQIQCVKNYQLVSPLRRSLRNVNSEYQQEVALGKQANKYNHRKRHRVKASGEAVSECKYQHSLSRGCPRKRKYLPMVVGATKVRYSFKWRYPQVLDSVISLLIFLRTNFANINSRYINREIVFLIIISELISANINYW